MTARPETETTSSEPSEEERFLASLLSDFEGTPRTIPHLGAARPAVEAIEERPRRIEVEISPRLLAGVNTMTRSRKGA